jgi:hypothetical protein
VAVNEISEISNLEDQFESLQELWINNNQVEDWASIEYLGNLKRLDNIYIAVNPVYSRDQQFRDAIKKAAPSLTQLEGSPINRPIINVSQPAGVKGIVKKGINPKAKAILSDIMGKDVAEQYEKDELAKQQTLEELAKQQKPKK